MCASPVFGLRGSTARYRRDGEQPIRAAKVGPLTAPSVSGDTRILVEVGERDVDCLVDGEMD